MEKSSKFFKDARQTSMALKETLRLALDTLRSHKLRTFLTLLGVILAVTTLVAVISVLNGLNLYVATKIANLGANAFIVDRFGIITNEAEWYKARKRPPIRPDDLQALQSDMKLASAVVGEQQTVADVRYQNQLIEDVNIVGASPFFAPLEAIDVATGRLLTEADEIHRSPVCVIGADVAKKFFPSGVNPIGKTIRPGQNEYEIVGVAKSLGTVLGQSRDNFVLITLSTYRKEWLTRDDTIMVFIQARNPEFMSAAEDEARVILRTRHHLRYQDPDDFGIIEPSSLMSLWQNLTGNIFAIAVWITSIFLVVGGIVIMNIMLASVTERTREIGVRKALGARRRHIIMQFLVESSLLSASGGAVGVLIALGIAFLVRAVSPVPISTPFFAIAIALALSTAVGLFFGIYPAVRASRLNPIEALRVEN
ncbi:MAG TPA: ABC transporter permease [Candidatus Acidoferrales bacterium]|nr:ABC transporter permease [Candidatus Acidoferrales bacterium]